MKKMFTLMMTLCLVASAFAASPLEAKKDLKLVSDQSQLLMDKPNMVLLEGIDFQQLKDLSNCPFKVYATNPDMLKSQMQAPVVRKARNAKPTEITFSKASAMYLGTYYYLTYETSLPLWEIVMTTTANDTIALDFIGYSGKYIEGMYQGVAGIIKMNGSSEVEISGDLTIAYQGAGTTTSPTYKFTANVADENGNEYTITGEYAFVNDLESKTPKMEVIDLGYYQMYYVYAMYCQMGGTQYCSYAEQALEYALITLQDAPVELTGETYQIDLKQCYTKRYDDGSKYWYVYGTSDEAINMIGFYGTFENIAGQYEEKDFYRYQTRLFSVSPDTVVGIDIYKPQSLEVTQKEDTTFFKESLIGRDGNVYNVSMFYVEPSSNDTITLPYILSGNYDDYTEERGTFTYAGIGSINQAGTQYAYLSLGVYADKPVGTFTTKDNYSNYNYIAILTQSDTTYYTAVVDTIKIIKAIDKYAEKYDYMATVLMLARNQADPTDVKWFKVVAGMISYYVMDATEDIETEFDEAKNDKIQFGTSNYQQYGFVQLQAMKADSSDYFYAAIFPKQIDKTYVLPLGIYPIDFSEKAPSVMASTGYEYISQLMYPTYYATIKDKTYENTWFIVEGTFTVETSQMVLEGKNANGKDVKITFKRNASALSDVKAETGKASKMIINGQLMIMKNGKLYNAQGAAVAE